MLNFTHNQANQNHEEISPHMILDVRMLLSKRQEMKKKIEENVEKSRFIAHCQWECKFGAVTMENSMEVPQRN